MLRKKAEPITSILHAFLREQGLETPLNEMRAQEAWESIAPPGIKRYTRSVEVRGGVLYVGITNPSIRANIMMSRSQLVQRINAEIGAQTITGIVCN